MAYDPEARRQSNSALIIALVSALVLGGGALAYFATRSQPEPAATTVINTPDRERTVVVNNTVSVPVPVVAPTNAPSVVVREAPKTVVVQPAPATNTVTRIERNSTTVRDRVVAPRPAGGTSSAGSTTPAASSNTNVTVNVPPAGGSGSATNSNSGAAAGSTDSGASSGAETAPAPAAAGDAAPAGGGGY